MVAETTLRSVRMKTKERMTRALGEESFGDLRDIICKTYGLI